MKGDPLGDEELLAIIRDRSSKADLSSTADAQQAKALRYYLGSRLGNEQEGRSQVVSRDVFEAVEGVKPDLMRVFTGGDSVVKFEPQGPEDIEQADQESEYINYLVMERNSGWLEIHDWIVDALLVRNGYLLAYWDQRTEVTETTYSGLSDDELAMLVEGEGVDVLEHEELPGGELGTVHNVRIRQTTQDGEVRVRCLEPERVRIDARHSGISLADASFVEYWEEKSLSELREEGFEVDDDIGMDVSDRRMDSAAVELARRPAEPTTAFERDDAADPASRRVTVYTCWIRVDADGDGIAELRRVVRVGSRIIYNETDERCTMACASITRMPHRHTGISLTDQTDDIQLIKSTMLRGMLDNLYLSINGRTAINKDTVNLDDLMTSRVGGIVRVAGSPSSEIMPLVHPHAGGEVLTAIEYLDGVKESRTGVTRYNQGLDANSLNKTATGVTQILNQAQQKTELRARVLAETGFKDLFLIVHMLVLKNRNRQDVFQLRNRYVAVNPTEWKSRRNLKVTVGLGTGDSVTRMRNLQMITSAQQAMMQIGLADRNTLYAGLIELTKAAGFKDAQSFWKDPKENEAPPPQQDPKMIEVQGRLQLDQQRLQLEAQKAQVEAEGRSGDRAAQAQIESMRIEFERQKATMHAQLEITKAALSHDVRRGEAKRQAAAELGIVTDDQAELDDQHAKDQQLQTLIQQVAALNEAVQVLARPRAVNHIRDQQGRLVRSEAVNG